MRLNAVPQFQGSMTERSPRMPEGSIVLAELASRVLGVPVNVVHQDRGTSPIEGGVANRAVLTGPNLRAQEEAVTGVEEPILTIGGDCGVDFAPIDARGSIDAERRAIESGMGVMTDQPAEVNRDASHIYIHVDVDVLIPVITELGELLRSSRSR